MQHNRLRHVPTHLERNSEHQHSEDESPEGPVPKHLRDKRGREARVRGYGGHTPCILSVYRGSTKRRKRKHLWHLMKREERFLRLLFFFYFPSVQTNFLPSDSQKDLGRHQEGTDGMRVRGDDERGAGKIFWLVIETITSTFDSPPSSTTSPCFWFGRQKVFLVYFHW